MHMNVVQEFKYNNSNDYELIKRIRKQVIKLTSIRIPQRHIFALNLPMSTELLLVGSNELTINQNTEIFLSVQIVMTMN
jgi:hypothetical protein